MSQNIIYSNDQHSAVPKGTIICIDDESGVLETLREQLLRFFGKQYRIELCRNGSGALRVLERLQSSDEEVPVILCDNIIPDMNGPALLEKINNLYPKILKVLITGEVDVPSIGRMINNADLFGYIPNPWNETDLFIIIKEALRRHENEKIIHEQTHRLETLYHQAREEIKARKTTQQNLEKALEEIKELKQQLEEENVYLMKRYQVESDFHQIIGKSEALQYVLYRAEKVAPGSTTVLILGETGTGKELIAQAIHNHSPRRENPMIRVNCAALPEDLIESELFGHEKGTFTGAYSQKIGKFELANGGTLFLDEIGELPLHLQAKILRAIESDEIERLGSNKSIKIDVRIIAATNRNLEKEIDENHFRKDLYFRLNVYPITLPPLRQRKEDIKMLVTHFVQIFNKKIGRNVKSIPQKALNALLTYDWPGNIRELENIIERGVILSQANELDIELPKTSKNLMIKGHSLDEIEKDAIIRALNIAKGKISGQSGAASYLKVNASTLRSKMKKLGIEKRSGY